MSDHLAQPIAVVGIAAIMPEAPDAATFWSNITRGKYSITDVPPERWDPQLYYDPDPRAPDKTYSRIGSWVRDFPWEPMAWRLPIPPTVAAQMDEGQRWAVSASRSALLDAGWPGWNVDPERVSVILGNALGGEKHYRSTLRIEMPELLRELTGAPSFAMLPHAARTAIIEETRKGYLSRFPEITEDTMPGELANVIAGRVANLLGFRGANFTTDAACASGLAAVSAAVHTLRAGETDAVVTGGVDRNMSVSAFVKFCKIGALSATGTRPFDAGADGFVMGEGCAIFVLKRLADAERDGDRVYAVLLGLGGSSDGKGKGITAPNPVGQRLAILRAWQSAGADPATAGAIEAHGTSTRAGDASELTSLTDVFAPAGAAPGSIALGSVKSNLGHLKAAAGAAGLFKMIKSLHERVLPPSLHFDTPNPNVDWAANPFRVNTELREWPDSPSGPRRGGVSAFGFGGTNFHLVAEEYVPGRYQSPDRAVFVAVPAAQPATTARAVVPRGEQGPKLPLRGALVVGGPDQASVLAQLEQVRADAAAGNAPQTALPDPALAGAVLRVAVDYADAADLTSKLDKTITALRAGNPAMFRMLRSQGVFVGGGAAPKVAFLYTGQGSQYVNMLQGLWRTEPIVTETFVEADRIMTPLLGRPLTSFIFADSGDEDVVRRLEQQLLQTEITQPAVLATDLALTRMLAAYGIQPDLVMGHSLGEYGALQAAGSLTFAAALEAVSARGKEMADLDVPDSGAMAAVFGPLQTIEDVVAATDGYVVIANINSTNQAVIGGATAAVELAVAACRAAGLNAIRIPVSHAFHTSIVAPASVPLVAMLRRLEVRAPGIPVVSNVTGDFYPADADKEAMLDLLGQQVASPVQFVKGLHTLYAAGARVFVEVGPKRALHGFVEDVLADHPDVLALFTNHPKLGDTASFNQALCGLYAAGFGLTRPAAAHPQELAAPSPAAVPQPMAPPQTAAAAPGQTPSFGSSSGSKVAMTHDRYTELGRMLAGVLEEGLRLATGAQPAGATEREAGAPSEPVVITGAALGLPGVESMFDDENIARILAGQQFIDAIPRRYRQQMVDMHITRLMKNDAGGPTFETIDREADVIKLAGRHAPLDVVRQFGIDAARDAALDEATRMAIGAGFDALRDAGIPLVLRYRTTTLGTQLPDRWGLPDALRDDTGVIFASAFPGYDSFAAELEGYLINRGRREQLLALEAIRARMRGDEPAVAETDRRIAELRHLLEAEPYTFDRRFLFRCLSMGHSQFAEIIGARGPNTQLNAACASTTQAISLAEDWIRAGRCRRVVVISADNATGEHLLPWISAGFLASGAAATDDVVEDAATPFDARRHGMIVGTGAAALVVESAQAARDRGLQPICEVLGAVTANSAFHGTRLDVDHICDVMETVVRQAEACGADRRAIAPSTVFVSHETYTPARGGSASAEINALRRVFGADADKIVIANTKGYTGHAMGAGIEDVVAVKALETGIVPPVPNFKEPDPELGVLNLSTGGAYPVQHALRLAAGFGSQIAMSVLRWTPVPDRRHRAPDELGYAYRIVDAQAWQLWLDRITGRAGAKLEVVQRRLRAVDPVAAHAGAAPVAPAAAVAPAAVPVPALAVPARPEPLQPAPVAPISPPAQTPGVAGDPIESAVLSLVSDLTGYPPGLLGLDLDLEADLGVDTVKQAEVFAAVRDRFNVERDPNLQLRDFPTLTHVITWVRDKTGTPAIPTQTAPTQTAPTQIEPVQTAVTAVAATPPAQTPGVAGDPIESAVVSLVSDLTGYPPELLDLDLDLEADLGVDTVKQAEVFAAVRDRFNVERDPNLQLRDFPTLTHVITWVRDKTGTPATTQTPPTAVAATPPAQAPGVAGDPIESAVVSLVSDLTGYPPELLDLDLDLEADLGVDTVKQAEVFAAVRDRFNVERDPNLQLRDFPTLTHVITWVRDKTGTPATTQTPPTAVAATPPAQAPGVAGDPIESAVVSLVSDLTGYPPELLDLDLDLEADLGVDTVKQAEVFAAVRDRFNVERDPNLQLRDFPTLTHVITWVRDKTGTPATPTQTPPTQTTTPVGPSTPSTPAATDADAVNDAVVSIVAEMTGYPPELLDPDLDLEADLGVDTVKQAEVFAAVRDRFNVERDPNLQLRDFPTLTHVITWVRDKTGTPAVSQDATAVASAPAETGLPVGEAAQPQAHAVPLTTPGMVVGDLAATDTLPRRIPVPVLRPDLALCKPTGVRLDGARVLVMLDEGGVGDALVRKLDKAGATVLSAEPGIGTDALLQRLDVWLAEGAIDGVYWLAALDDEGPLEGLDPAAWQEALRRRVKALYATMRRLYQTSPFLVAGTRLGGYHGYDAAGATCPLGGSVTGFTKSYKRERPDALVKAVDVPLSRKTAALADVLIEETLTDPGCVEIGRADGQRWGVGLLEQPFPCEDTGMTLDKDTVVLVTGAAGSIVSAITADLATASAGTFHLLDLTPTPDPADPDLRRFLTDRDGLKTELAGRMRDRGERPTPVAIERELARFERLAAALAAIQAVERAGGHAHYHSVNLTDPQAVAAVVDQVRQLSGRVDVLLHAAGLEISRNLPEKEPREYDLVFDVKSNGWHNLLHAAADLPIAATVAFSSVAGRFGNAGQSDYSAANDLLCKVASSLRRTRPGTRAIALDWTAWGGIGMATRGSIPKIMEMAGVQMLPPQAGVAWIRRELTASPYRGEVVVAGVLGMMAAEFDPTGGLDPAALDAAVREAGMAGPMVGSAATASVHDGLVVHTTLDPSQQPFLDNHRIDGIPVLPGVMGMEAFAEVSRLLAPGWRVAGLEDVGFHAPVKFYRDEPRTLTITALLRPDGPDLLARCRLVGERVLPGSDVPQRTVHFTGSVRLTRDGLTRQNGTENPVTVPIEQGTPSVTPDEVYALYFHGPAYQVIGSAWSADGGALARMADDLGDNHRPGNAPTVIGPRLAELCFQTAGLWEAGREGRLALPLHVDRLVLPPFGDGTSDGSTDNSTDNDTDDDTRYALARPSETGPDGFDCLVVDSGGLVVLRMDGYHTVPLPVPLPADVVAPMQAAFKQ